MTETAIIDERNENIWNEINDHFVTEIQVHDRQHCYSFVRNKTAFLYVPSDNLTIESFTRELLRLYLKARRIFIADFLANNLKYEPLLTWNCNDNLLEEVGNYLEEIKILPIYLHLGFDRKLFSENFDRLRCSHNNILLIHSGLSKKIPSKASADMFIHKFFAIKADPNPENDYSGILDDLKQINEDLYNILEEFYLQWLSFDISRYDPATYTYKDFTTSFLHKLGQWMVRTFLLQLKGTSS